MANEAIGRLEAVGIGKESTAGTKVAAGYWLPKEGGTLKPIIEKAKDTSGYGRIEEAYDSQKVKEMTELQLEGIVRDKTFGMLLLWAFGGLATTGAWPYTHAFTVANNNSHKSFTLWGVSDAATHYSTYAMLDELSITCEKGDYVRYSATFRGKKMQTDTKPAVSYVSDNEFLGKHVNVKLADSEAGLAAADPIAIERIEFTINKNLTDYQALGDDDVDAFFNQQFTISGNFEGLFNSQTLLGFVKDDTKKFMKIEIINTEVDLDENDYPEISFIFGKASFDEWDKTSDNNGLVKQTIGFEAQFNNSEGYLAKATLFNAVASY